MNLYEQINIIRNRPGNYIGNPTLNNLKKFIDGVLFSLEVNNINDDFDNCFKNYFNWYVNFKLLKVCSSNKLKEDLEYNGGRGFVKLIELVEESNQKQISLFFDIFNDFYMDFKNEYDFQSIVDELK